MGGDEEGAAVFDVRGREGVRDPAAAAVPAIGMALLLV